MDLDIGVIKVSEGLASALVMPRDMTDLGRALDPSGGLVVLEDHDGSAEWHEAVLAFPTPDSSQRRLQGRASRSTWQCRSPTSTLTRRSVAVAA